MLAWGLNEWNLPSLAAQLTRLLLGCVSPPFCEGASNGASSRWENCILASPLFPLRSLLHTGCPQALVVILWANQDLDQLVVLQHYWWQFSNGVLSVLTWDDKKNEITTEIPPRRNCYQYYRPSEGWSKIPTDGRQWTRWRGSGTTTWDKMSLSFQP